MALGDATRRQDRRIAIERTLTQHWHRLVAHPNARDAHASISNVATDLLDTLDELTARDPAPRPDLPERPKGFAHPEHRKAGW